MAGHCVFNPGTAKRRTLHIAWAVIKAERTQRHNAMSASERRPAREQNTEAEAKLNKLRVPRGRSFASWLSLETLQ
eukprot:4802869-Alexandrium_andersonii.AAC.1